MATSLGSQVLDDREQLYPQDMDRATAERSATPPLLDLAVADAAPLDAAEQALCAAIGARQTERIALLCRLVDQNSGSKNATGIGAVQAMLVEQLRPLGFSVEHHAPEPCPGYDATLFGPHVVLRRPGLPGTPRVLLFGHADTVFEPSSGFVAQRIDGERMVGPGCADMKGGLTVLGGALRALHSDGELDRLDVTVLLNGDEEVSSRGSRPLVEALARQAQLGLCFEPGRDKPWGALTLARKGMGSFVLTVHGRAAHSGNRFTAGLNAVDEAARKALALARLTDLTRGRTVNVGVFTTGPSAKRNVVAERCTLEFDLRSNTAADCEEVVAAIRHIASQSLVRNPWTQESARCELQGGLTRPPMACTPPVAALYALVAGLAARLDIAMGATASGGGSDANLTAAQGLLTLDGLGPIGGAYHTEQEWLHLPSLDDRARLAALLLRRLGRGQLVLPSAP